VKFIIFYLIRKFYPTFHQIFT